MSATILPPTAPSPVSPSQPEQALHPSDNDGGNGTGGGDSEERRYGPNEEPEANPERWATPLSAYRTVALFAVFSVTSVFAAITHVLASRWVHSKDWLSVSLPHILYLNTVVLLISSWTIELARRSLAREAFQRCLRWLSVTLFLGTAFVAGQIMAWREFVFRGFYLTSNPGSFFFYFLTAAHGLHLLAAVLALAYVMVFANRLVRRGRQQTAVNTVAFCWHFLDGLWLYVLALLFMTIQH